MANKVELYEVIEFREKFALFADERILEKDLEIKNPNLHLYYIRHADDDDSVFAELNTKPVYVNFAGTIITKFEIDFGDKNYISINDDDVGFYGIEFPLSIYLSDKYDVDGVNSDIAEDTFTYFNDLDDENDEECYTVDTDGNITYVKFKDGTEQWNEYDSDGNLIHRVETPDKEYWWEYSSNDEEDINTVRDNTGWYETRIYHKTPNYVIVKNPKYTEKHWTEDGSMLSHRASTDGVEEWYRDNKLVQKRSGKTLTVFNDDNSISKIDLSDKII